VAESERVAIRIGQSQ